MTSYADASSQSPRPQGKRKARRRVIHSDSGEDSPETPATQISMIFKPPSTSSQAMPHSPQDPKHKESSTTSGGATETSDVVVTGRQQPAKGPIIQKPSGPGFVVKAVEENTLDSAGQDNVEMKLDDEVSGAGQTL